jgi:hypothetical protein
MPFCQATTRALPSSTATSAATCTFLTRVLPRALTERQPQRGRRLGGVVHVDAEHRREISSCSRYHSVTDDPGSTLPLPSTRTRAYASFRDVIFAHVVQRCWRVGHARELFYQALVARVDIDGPGIFEAELGGRIVPMRAQRSAVAFYLWVMPAMHILSRVRAMQINASICSASTDS